MQYILRTNSPPYVLDIALYLPPPPQFGYPKVDRAHVTPLMNASWNEEFLAGQILWTAY